jgi:DNA anti-recombination protein RmuC
MNIDFSKLKFQTNWASATTIVTLLVAVITLYMTNNSLKGQVDGLKDSNEALSKTVGTLGESVSALKGAQDVTSKAIEIFMQNPPAELKYRLERIETILSHQGHDLELDTVSKPFNNNRPH